MFNVEIMPEAPREEGARVPYIEGQFEFNDIKCPLWSFIERDPSRGEKRAVQSEDHLRGGISNDPPGSRGRRESLRAFYATQERGIGPQGEMVYRLCAESPFEEIDED
jgi:hypothetical protein